MSSYEFIVDGMKYSYSSISSFETCPYSFKLMYIDYKDRINNFFAEHGTLMHNCFEQFFNGNLESYELTKYFTDNYDIFVKADAPDYPAGMKERYIEQGIEFFNNFSFEKDDYEITNIESKIDFELAPGITFTGRPDLVLKSKKTGKYGLWDYKSSAPFRTNKRTGEEITDTKKLEGYYKQMYLYAHALREHKNIPIETITLWFTRPDRKVTVEWEEEKEKKAIKWAIDVINRIKKEEEFPYNNSEKFFCDNLCSVREHCEYRQ